RAAADQLSAAATNTNVNGKVGTRTNPSLRANASQVANTHNTASSNIVTRACLAGAAAAKLASHLAAAFCKVEIRGLSSVPVERAARPLIREALGCTRIF